MAMHNNARLDIPQKNLELVIFFWEAFCRLNLCLRKIVCMILNRLYVLPKDFFMPTQEHTHIKIHTNKQHIHVASRLTDILHVVKSHGKCHVVILERFSGKALSNSICQKSEKEEKQRESELAANTIISLASHSLLGLCVCACFFYFGFKQV